MSFTHLTPKVKKRETLEKLLTLSIYAENKKNKYQYIEFLKICLIFFIIKYY